MVRCRVERGEAREVGRRVLDHQGPFCAAKGLGQWKSLYLVLALFCERSVYVCIAQIRHICITMCTSLTAYISLLTHIELCFQTLVSYSLIQSSIRQTPVYCSCSIWFYWPFKTLQNLSPWVLGKCHLRALWGRNVTLCVCYFLWSAKGKTHPKCKDIKIFV